MVNEPVGFLHVNGEQPLRTVTIARSGFLTHSIRVRTKRANHKALVLLERPFLFFSPESFDVALPMNYIFSYALSSILLCIIWKPLII